MPSFSRAGLLVPVILLAAPAAAQDEVTFRSDTRLVVLHATVTDKGGKLVTGLPREIFKVYENGKEQQVRAFKREDIPVSLGIIVDNSGSMRNRRKQVEAAALALVKASNPQDEVFIVNFNDEAFLDVAFTSRIEKLEEGLARIDAKGGTAMRDAVSMSIDYVKSDGKKDKKVLLIVTDGNDTASMSMTLERLVEKAHRSEVLVYAIGILSEESKSDAAKARRALNALTAASGGASYYPKELAEVESTCLQVAHDIRNQYVLQYSPANQNMDGKFRPIKVTAGGRYIVRTRTGYYATPQGAAGRASAPPAASSLKR